MAFSASVSVEAGPAVEVGIAAGDGVAVSAGEGGAAQLASMKKMNRKAVIRSMATSFLWIQGTGTAGTSDTRNGSRLLGSFLYL